ncbi:MULTISPECIES: YCF48-related protein [unclassified Flavobacterium]|uniref:T9SS type A sorting domain-containing protein n=1 Tax=unclassified Flavobacterium TaxID=196869 RepID=UPI001F13CD53|nr:MULTISPECIES: YCF48-related protein [unclassified Flavobacterium]UMY67158.1 YCF48-related protein [Flavobacterium sp. HJ-32-4]
MKQSLLLLLLLSLPFSASYGQWWTPQSSGTSQPLNDVFCLTPEEVVVVGESGTILKTTNGGTSWSTRASGSASSLYRVQFLDALQGVAVGSGGTILKTSDAGETWTPVDSGVTDPLYGLSILNESVWFVSGENGTLRKTVDSGATFTTLSFPVTTPIVRLQFLNANVGYAMSEGLYKTTDGGATWELKYALPYQSIYFATPFYFITPNIGFIANQEGTVFRTTDGGDIFSAFSSAGFGPLDVFASNDASIWAVNNAATLCGCDSFCISKFDLSPDAPFESAENCELGGENTGRFQAIRFANATTGYVVGQSGKIYKNTTGMMGPLATNTFDWQAIRLYPNPSSGRVTVYLGQNAPTSMTLEIADSMGKVVYNAATLDREAIVDVSRWAKGLYFLSVTAQGQRHTEKLIVN